MLMPRQLHETGFMESLSGEATALLVESAYLLEGEIQRPILGKAVDLSVLITRAREIDDDTNQA